MKRLKLKLNKDAYMPVRAHMTDAGLDLRTPHEVTVPAHGSAVIDTGVCVELPKNTVGFLKSKSGLNVRYGITSEGVIAVGYTGSIRVKLYNHSGCPYRVEKGDKISQLVIMPIYIPRQIITDNIPISCPTIYRCTNNWRTNIIRQLCISHARCDE